MKKLFIYLTILSIFPMTGACEDSLGVDDNVIMTDKVVNTGKQFIEINEENFGFEIKGYSDITFEDDGTMWMISEGALVRFDYLSKQFFSVNQLLNRFVGGFLCIDIDSKNNKWIGTGAGWDIETNGFIGGGLFKFDGNKTTKIGAMIWADILIDDSDNIFLDAGSPTGFNVNDDIYIYTNQGEWINLEEKYNIWRLSDSYYAKIRIDNNGKLYLIWFAGKDTGEGMGFKGFTIIDIDNNEVEEIYIRDYSSTASNPVFDKNNILWLAIGGEIFKYNNKELEKFDTLSNIYCIAVDHENNKWFINDDGITKYDNNILSKIDVSFFNPGCENYIASFDKLSNMLISYEDSNGDYHLILFREDGVLLPEEAVSVMEKRQQKIGKASIFPNPFSQSTIINYELRMSGYISLELFDMLGNEVSTLVDGFMPAGRHEARFDGSSLAPGVYFYVLRAGSDVVTEKIVKF